MPRGHRNRNKHYKNRQEDGAMEAAAGALPVVDEKEEREKSFEGQFPSAICSMLVDVMEGAIATNECGHSFDSNSIRDYVRRQNENGEECVCPLCRASMSEDKLRQNIALEGFIGEARVYYDQTAAELEAAGVAIQKATGDLAAVSVERDAAKERTKQLETELVRVNRQAAEDLAAASEARGEVEQLRAQLSAANAKAAGEEQQLKAKLVATKRELTELEQHLPAINELARGRQENQDREERIVRLEEMQQQRRSSEGKIHAKWAMFSALLAIVAVAFSRNTQPSITPNQTPIMPTIVEPPAELPNLAQSLPFVENTFSSLVNEAEDGLVVKEVDKSLIKNMEHHLGLTTTDKAFLKDYLVKVLKKNATSGVVSQKQNDPLYQKDLEEAIEWLLTMGQGISINDPIIMLPNPGKPEVLKVPALHYAAYTGNIDAIKALLKAGADIDHQEKFGNMPLYYAVSTGKYDAVKLLVEEGAKIDKKNTQGDTALELAKSSKQTKILKFLKEHANDTKPKAVLPSKKETQRVEVLKPAVKELQATEVFSSLLQKIQDTAISYFTPETIGKWCAQEAFKLHGSNVKISFDQEEFWQKAFTISRAGIHPDESETWRVKLTDAYEKQYNLLKSDSGVPHSIPLSTICKPHLPMGPATIGGFCAAQAFIDNDHLKIEFDADTLIDVFYNSDSYEAFIRKSGLRSKWDKKKYQETMFREFSETLAIFQDTLKQLLEESQGNLEDNIYSRLTAVRFKLDAGLERDNISPRLTAAHLALEAQLQSVDTPKKPDPYTPVAEYDNTAAVEMKDDLSHLQDEAKTFVKRDEFLDAVNKYQELLNQYEKTLTKQTLCDIYHNQGLGLMQHALNIKKPLEAVDKASFCVRAVEKLDVALKYCSGNQSHEIDKQIAALKGTLSQLQQQEQRETNAADAAEAQEKYHLKSSSTSTYKSSLWDEQHRQHQVSKNNHYKMDDRGERLTTTNP